MDFRFKFVMAGFLLALIVLINVGFDMMSGFTGVFVSLGLLLVFAAVALFPNANRGDAADRSKAGGGWSDHIEFEDRGGDNTDSGWR